MGNLELAWSLSPLMALRRLQETRRAGGAAGDPGRPAVEEHAAPELERDERPELEVELPSALVQLEQPLDGAGVQDPAPPARVREEQGPHEAPEPPPEPAPERHREAVLRPVEDLVGQEPPHGALEDVLGGAVAHLQL